MHVHLLGDEIQTTFDCALGLYLVLLQQHGADELVNLLAVLEVVELLQCISLALIRVWLVQGEHSPLSRLGSPASELRVFAAPERWSGVLVTFSKST